MSKNNTFKSVPIEEFISESDEILQRVQDLLHSIENKGYSKSVVDELYRNLHTLKGTSQLFGFTQMGLLSHSLEASMEPLRQYEAPISKNLVDVFYKAVNLLEDISKSLKHNETDLSFKDLVNELIPEIIEAAGQQFSANYKLNRDELNPIFHEKELNYSTVNEKQSTRLGNNSDAIAEINYKSKDDVAKKEASTIKLSMNEIKIKDNELINQELIVKDNSNANISNNSLHDATIRVQVQLLDQIMNLVGELVLVRNGILQYKNKDESLEYANLAHSIDEVSTKLQFQVMKTRMQPVGTVVNKFQRLVRETATELNKKIDLTLIGSETEIDKTLLEAIKDPLTHIIRNSCDHGIESPEDRIKSGKPENGHILIRSYHEGGQVVIEVSDDGKGMDRAKILAKGIEKGLINQEIAGRLSEREILNLIFAPGFSTAQKITNVSGRGVGMDVVKTNIEKIGGTVVLMSTLGKGTTIKLVIPLTLAILQSLIVKSSEDRFAIPQLRLVELVRFDMSVENDLGKVQMLQGRPMLKLRGDLLPLIGLNEVLTNATFKPASDGVLNIVVVNSDGENFGLVVDEIMETSDIVVKPLANFLKNESIFSGATLLGDGTVSLILDVQEIAEKFHIKPSGDRAKASVLDSHLLNQKIVNSDAQDFFIFKINSKSIGAVPLCLVHRLEEFPVNKIEVSGEQKMVRYRNILMPLIDLASELKLGSSDLSSSEKVSIFVMEKSNRYYGIIVNEILDVLFIESAIDEAIRDRFGILGNIIYKEQIFTVIDAISIVNKFLNKTNQVSGNLISDTKNIEADKAKKTKILVAEDVSFFRRQIGKILENEGFEVLMAEDGEKAIGLLNSDHKREIKLLLSDIEMPNKNGLELAREVKRNEKLSKLKLIALTTKNKEADVKEGYAAGFDDYLEKLNSDKLLQAIKKQLDIIRD